MNMAEALAITKECAGRYEDVPDLLGEVGRLQTACSAVLEEMLREKGRWTGGESNYPAWLDRWPAVLSAALGGPKRDGEQEGSR